ncbi:BfmA/BtgA family mobilization protein [Flagellimonas okinawensis]|uniref:BfmA/BtgA family mobilization protein n=1 Tax=Flagellimonas okinawensis TaxID=3031324 RepID=A0ABT5XR38_9FLAO|nr:BfmA/BtgA family mobilization protein [[Muricauda] okinawensis]MDF0708363.1 BfmA/BtgA family mobilization protein [[Muricauda] okinawensis]
MDKGYEKEKFNNMAIKKSVAMQFRRFSKKFGRSRSMTLLAMLDFFERHGISPDQEMGETIASLKYLIKRRFNAMVAIMRSIEKEQTLPTVGMMQALFNQELESDGEEWEGDFDFFEQQLTEMKTPSNPKLLDTEVTVSKIRYKQLEEQMEELKSDFGYVLEHVVESRNRIGKKHLIMDLDPEAIDKYKRKLR